MPWPRSAKEASCESKIAAELLGFHLCESCLKLNEDCRKKFVYENAKEHLKGITEDVAKLKLIIRTTDKLVGAIKKQGKQIEELQQNLKELNKVSIKKLDENKEETKQWSSLFENKVETKVYRYWESPRISDRHKLKNINEQWETKKTKKHHSLQFDRRCWKVKRKRTRVKAPERNNRKKIEKEILVMFRIFKTKSLVDKIRKFRSQEHGSG